MSTLRFLLLALLACTNFAHGDYKLDSNKESKTWIDPKTKLEWMRCAVGQVFTENRCNGEAIKLAWRDAMEYPNLFNEKGFIEKKDWRLPSVNELLALRHCSNGWHHKIKAIGNLTKDMGVEILSISTSKTNVMLPSHCNNGSLEPALDASIFSGTPTNYAFWSSSVSRDGGFPWRISSIGRPNYGYYDYQDNYGYIRLVRSSN